MTLIFFDLETSDKQPCGQILNYAFIETDNRFQIQDELSGDIALSLLQIPAPEALLTNRIRIIDHQQQCYPSEPQVMKELASFIGSVIERSQDQVYLCGYNSARFDLPFLRTSFIRNGINPYFSGKLRYADILHLVRKAYVSSADFPEVYSEDREQKLSLKLELVSKALGISQGPQTHNSREDVLLTISLASSLSEKFGLHPAATVGYEVLKGQEHVVSLVPDYTTGSGHSRSLKACLGLLSETYRAALWIDLARYQSGQGRAAVSWYNKNGGQLLCQQEPVDHPKCLEILASAKREFHKLTPDNFFEKSSCDIEQDIYRLDMQKISTLWQIIWGNERSQIDSIKDPDLQALVARYFLAYGVSSERRGANWHRKFKEYARYRYSSGKFQLVKNIRNERESSESEPDFHRSISDILSSINQLKTELRDPEDREILLQLEGYIHDSLIYKEIA